MDALVATGYRLCQFSINLSRPCSRSCVGVGATLLDPGIPPLTAHKHPLLGRAIASFNPVLPVV